MDAMMSEAVKAGQDIIDGLKSPNPYAEADGVLGDFFKADSRARRALLEVFYIDPRSAQLRFGAPGADYGRGGGLILDAAGTDIGKETLAELVTALNKVIMPWKMRENRSCVEAAAAARDKLHDMLVDVERTP